MIVWDQARSTEPVERHRISVRGQVQGVGFRPFVYRLATELGLAGWVRNDAVGVEIEVEGRPSQVERFRHRLRDELPPLARIDGIDWQMAAAALDTVAPALPDVVGPEGAASVVFAIRASAGGAVATGVTPDSVVCAECLEELFDPGNRRYRYPFINCTHCGPRYTLTAAIPYDRPNTSMAAFAQCPKCLAEYRDPLHRRFHAQPNACPDCGPALRLLDPSGAVLADGRVDDATGGDAIAETVRMLQAGKIVAVKGLGGFHLLCDARDPVAVRRLRTRKHREAKPLAVLAVHPQALEGLVEVGAEDLEHLVSRERPIVLLRKRPGCDDLLPDVAPGLAWLGAMLAYTPVHYLLFHEVAGRPAGKAWMAAAPEAGGTDWLLVCTSANPGGEPLVIGNSEALRRLEGIADAVLVHDRDILVRCDDSVIRVGVEGPAFLRRARGYTPTAIRLAASGPPTLALGGWLKNTICVTRGDEAFLSQHIGDLDNAATCLAQEAVVEHLLEVLQIQPERVACDLHPDFHSSHLAARWAETLDVPLIRVQHHHAHLAAVQAEHGLLGPMIGIAMDGVGLGLDGKAWGGELLRLDGARLERLGHLLPLALPGGDRAAREPWRMAAAALHALGRGSEIPMRFPGEALAHGVRELLDRGVGCPPTTSLGRHFDAAAGLLGIQAVQRFEGQAAMRLEGLAARHGIAGPVADGWRITADQGLDLCPLLAWVADAAPGLPKTAPGDGAAGDPLATSGEPVWAKAATAAEVARVAAVFHATVAAGLVEWIATGAEGTGIRDLAFSGGCVLNQVLMQAIKPALEQRGFRVWLPSRAPANDGGLSLGQAWVAMRSEG